FADEELGNWWRAFAEAKDNKEREALVKSVVPDGSSPARRRRRRRKPKPQEPAQA
ncbi:MAG: polynucleotide adenylyltransferase PcnB, partial [Oscillospiraceae bacterium]|nr:polynucleotide adenylyltransferase PcnB [Oscillospiraceae bacterium]